jgi:hypothetical protein
VVGDSLLIVRQLEQYRPPKHARLHDLYKQARGLADHLGVARWHHHLRAYNKKGGGGMLLLTAQWTAGTASSPFILRPGPTGGGIELLFQGDFLHWRAAYST